jgi:type II secretion system protein G
MKKGFTLIELLIVVAIIGILAAIAVPNFLNAQMRARVARVQADFKSLDTALEMYRLDNNAFPNDHDLDAYDNGHEHGLFSLTSPISYMSSVPPNPFVNKDLASTFGFSGNDTNAYGSNGRADYEMGSGSDNAEPYRKHAWSLMSHGPDMDDDIGAHDSFPFAVFIKPYDSSNGLSSNGDLYRVGGDTSAGCFYVGWSIQTAQKFGNNCN